MPSKPLRYIVTGLASLIVLSSVFTAGLLAGWLAPVRPAALAAFQWPAATPASGAASTPSGLQKLFGPFWQAWDLVHQQYARQPVDDTRLMRGAISGMIAALDDPHSSYMDPSTYEQITTRMEGEYEGIGAWVDATGSYLQIISPMPGSPAEKAGLKPGDLVVAIDGQDMTGVDGELARQKVIGPSGTQVRLTIQRQGVEKPLEFIVTRSKIALASVEGHMLENGVAYVQIITFAESTDQELREILTDLLKQKPKGLIVDLRYNGGGFLQTAIEVGSEFIPKGLLLTEQYGTGEQHPYSAQPGGIATEIPLVMLVNEGSASASEIVAGAIQDSGRGKLVGTTTFGKGSVQIWTALKDDQGAVRITVARWLTPKGRQIEGVGLKPDVEVALTEADIQAKKDTQLERAVQVLLGK